MTIPPDVRAYLDEYFGDPVGFPPEFKTWITKYVEAFPPTLPVSQLTGFSQFTVKQGTGGADLTASGMPTGTSQSGTGPQLLAVGPGNYVIIAFATFSFVSAGGGWMDGDMQIRASGILPSPLFHVETVTTAAVQGITTGRSYLLAVPASTTTDLTTPLTVTNNSGANAGMGISNAQMYVIRYANL